MVLVAAQQFGHGATEGVYCSADGGSTWNIVPSASGDMGTFVGFASSSVAFAALGFPYPGATRSEEHTSELQSRSDLVCRLLLEKKKNTGGAPPTPHHYAQRHPTTRPR